METLVYRGVCEAHQEFKRQTGLDAIVLVEKDVVEAKEGFQRVVRRKVKVYNLEYIRWIEHRFEHLKLNIEALLSKP